VDGNSLADFFLDIDGGADKGSDDMNLTLLGFWMGHQQSLDG